jgi:hypothetical protein
MDDNNIISASTSRKWGLISAACGLVVFLVFYFLGYPGRARVSATITGVFVFVVRFRWDLRGRRWFWSLISALALIHFAIIFCFAWSNWRYPGPVLIPFVFIDFAIYMAVIFLSEKIFRPSTS